MVQRDTGGGCSTSSASASAWGRTVVCGPWESSVRGPYAVLSVLTELSFFGRKVGDKVRTRCQGPLRVVVRTEPCHPHEGEPGERGGESAWVKNHAVPGGAAWLQGKRTVSTVLS